MRGSRSIFQSLFKDDIPPAVVAAPARKGRSEEHLQKRNEMLVCRYYYYSRIADKQYQNVLSALEEELFLSQRTIVDIVNANYELLKKINAEKPDIRYFRTKYPFMVWATTKSGD